MLSTYLSGLDEFRIALSQWRVAHLIGINQLRNRYSRSRIGQFWVTLTTLVTVIAFGLVWSLLWQAPIETYIPYVAVTSITWTLMTGVMNDATGAIPASSGYFLNNHVSFTGIVYSLVYRNVLVWLHNLAAIALVWLWFRWSPGPEAFLAIPGVVLNIIFLTLLAQIIAFACTRFRDLVQLIGNVLQIAFFLTPVMWQPEYLPESGKWLIEANPFASLLAIVADPLLGRDIKAQNWYVALGSIGVMLVLAPLVVGKWRHRLIYWI